MRNLDHKHGIEECNKANRKNGEWFIYINEKRVLGAAGTGLQSPDPVLRQTLSFTNIVAGTTITLNKPA